MKTFDDLTEYNQYIGLAMPLDHDFDIQQVDYGDNELFALPMQAFSHKFYSVGFYENLNIEIKAGFSNFQSQGPFVFIKTPNQIVSWQIKPGLIKGWNLVFTERFLMKYKLLTSIVQDFPFMQIDNALPFEINETDTSQLNQIYLNILEEYHSGRSDRFDLIASHFYTLLLTLKRLYAADNTGPANEINLGHDYDRLLYQRYMSLLEQDGGDTEDCGSCSVAYFAEKLTVHPNYLNAAVKRVTGHNALHFIQERIINIAKTYLLQSTLSIKEISFELCFNEPTHFGAFFKKHTGVTPIQFRKQSQI